MPYAIGVALDDTDAGQFVFAAQKTMYGGKAIAAGDELFVFYSGTPAAADWLRRPPSPRQLALPRREGVERQTPLVSITARRTATAARPLGRLELKPFSDWGDGRPETELNFKFYRQATDKIVGISDATAAFLRGCMRSPRHLILAPATVRGEGATTVQAPTISEPARALQRLDR